MPNSPSEAVVSDFNNRNGKISLSIFRDQLLEKIGDKSTYKTLEELYGVNRFYLWHIIRDPKYKPPVKVHAKLGIEILSSVIVVGEGIVPPGAQAIRAQLCECGEYFISNHPRRQKCFKCSPFRKAKK